VSSSPARSRDRWKFAFAHLLISIAIVGGLLLALLWLWVEPALWPLVAPSRPLLLLLVAVVLAGPLLTWLVYRVGKLHLRMDLALIVAIQLLFLGYAATMLCRSRPVFMVASVDRLELVAANEIDREDLIEAKLSDWKLSWTGPRLVGLRLSPLPASGDLFAGAENDFPSRPSFYVPYTQTAPELLEHASPMETLSSRSSGDRAFVSGALKRIGRTAAQVRFVPITSRKGAATMLLDAVDGTPLRALALNPWVLHAPAADTRNPK